jgi:hypothetical protein
MNARNGGDLADGGLIPIRGELGMAWGEYGCRRRAVTLQPTNPRPEMSSAPSLRVVVYGRLARKQGEIAIAQADFPARQVRRLAQTQEFARQLSGG